MAHKLERFSKAIFNSPQLITQEKYEEIAEFLDSRNNEQFFVQDAEESLGNEKPSIENGIGTLSVHGVITAERSQFESLCDMTSYPKLIEDMNYFVKEGVKTVFMDLNSGGGSAHLCMETASNLRNKADDNGINLIGYVNGSCGSAAMALASVCHELYANGTSKVGSIGCVVSLIDNSEQLKKEGLKRIFITSTEGKVPFAEDGSFKKQFLDDVKEDVMVLHNSFVAHINKFRSITPDSINAMSSKMFRADVALKEGLIDGVKEVEEFYDYLASKGTEESLSTEKPCDDKEKLEQASINAEQFTTPEDVIKMTEQTVTPEMLADMKAQMDAQAEQLSAYKAKEVEAQKAKLAEQLEANAPFLSNKEVLVEFLMSADETNTQLVNTLIADCALEVKNVQEAFDAKQAEAEAKLAAEIEEAKAVAQEAQAEAEEIKEEFGTTEHSVKADLKEVVATKDLLAEKIARKQQEMLK